MIPLFKSKYLKRLEKEKQRENEIQTIQQVNQSTREWAVRHYDELNHSKSHLQWTLLAGAVWGLTGVYTLNAWGKSIQVLNKGLIWYPIIGSCFLTGTYLYQKLRGQYLSPDNLSHIGFSGFNPNPSLVHWSLNLKDKYNTANIELESSEIDSIIKTPFELEKENFERQLNSIGVDGKKVIERHSKDRDDIHFLFGKVRNLENIAFLDDTEINVNYNSPIELQLKLDSINPVYENFATLNELLEKYHENLGRFKHVVENLPKFPSDKDKLLGMPFFAYRHRQLPVPEPGTWQYDLFEEIYGKPYHYLKKVFETQKKINKFNYHLFLHPSIIEKYDTESEEFDQYLRTLNLQFLTEKEKMTKFREEYSRNFMPLLNTINDPSVGRQIVHYILNKRRSENYDNYLFERYSNQREEELFRTAEEAKFLDKNKNYLFTVQYSTVDADRIGIKKEELNEIVNNPTKQKELRDAFQTAYPSYDPVSKMDMYKHAYKRVSYNETLLENEDKLGEDFDWSEKALDDLQYEDFYSDEDEMLNNFTGHTPHFHDISQPAGGKVHANLFYYNNWIDMNDYQERTLQVGFISPKAMRLTLYQSGILRSLSSQFYRMYNNPKWAEFNTKVHPAIDSYNEDKAEKVRRKSNRYKYFERDEIISSDREIREFLEKTTEEELEESKPKSITEELIDQALFEAQYIKKGVDNNELKKLSKRNPLEIKQLFWAIGFEPYEDWMDTPGREPFTNLGYHRYIDKVQMQDPFYHLLSEIEQPYVIKDLMRHWRRGAEIRFKVPYYPETKNPEKTFEYNF